MATSARPVLAGADQGASMAPAPCLGHHKKFGQTAMAAFRLDDKQMTRRVMGEGPAHWLSPRFRNKVLRDQHDAVFFGTAMLQFAPMVDGEIGIAAAVRLERRFINLQSADEREDCRFVLRQAGFSDTNGRGP